MTSMKKDYVKPQLVELSSQFTLAAKSQNATEQANLHRSGSRIMPSNKPILLLATLAWVHPDKAIVGFTFFKAPVRALCSYRDSYWLL